MTMNPDKLPDTFDGCIARAIEFETAAIEAEHANARFLAARLFARSTWWRCQAARYPRTRSVH